jgi:hypothetical protein
MSDPSKPELCEVCGSQSDVVDIFHIHKRDKR